MLCAAAPAAAVNYVLGPRDIISITVYEQKDLDVEARIAEDGQVNLPLIGQVTAAGRTVKSFEADLEAKYSEYIYGPQVTVFIKEYHSLEVSVLGEVKKPGLYQLSGDSTLMELASQVGGFTHEAGGTLVILRPSKEPGGKTEAIIIDTEKLLGGDGAAQNIKIYDGDTINVPKADVFFVFGEVKKPGSYKMESDVAHTVIKAISIAGGFTDMAAKKSIKITREVGAQTMEFKADMHTQVQPHDIIVVPESFF